MKFDIITIFPEMFTALDFSITSKAIQYGILEIKCWNPRDYSKSKHRNVDSRPYGGGPGMVMMAQPLCDTIKAIKKTTNHAKIIYLTPQGQLLNQNKIKSLAKEKNITLIAGRYEGIDERVVESEIDEELSIGDYVLSGGEIAAMVVIDAVTRMLPNVLGHENSAKQDSFMEGLLDYPHYTRPEIFNGQNVPKVLLKGNHKEIARWRLQQALGRTYLRRPELLKKYRLTKTEQELLNEFLGNL